MRRWNAAALLALGLSLLALFGAQGEEAVVDLWEAFEEAGVEQIADPEDLAEDTEDADAKPFLSGYLRIASGTVLYADANRKDPLGYPTQAAYVYAERTRKYEKGSLYRLRFDTQRTAGGERPEVAYVYLRRVDALEEGERAALFAGQEGARVDEGIPLTTLAFHYGALSASESQFNVVTASGEGVVAQGGTNLRLGPGRTYGMILQLKRGTKLTIKGLRNASGETWYLVSDPEGNEGFILGSLVQFVPDAAQAQEPEALEEEAKREAADLPAEESAPEREAQDAEPAGEEPAPIQAPERGVRVEMAWQGEKHVLGGKVLLRAVLEGYEGATFSLQWQSAPDAEHWKDLPGATGETLLLDVTQDNLQKSWRVLVTAEPAAR